MLSRLVHFMCMSVFTVYINQEKSVFTFFICIIIFNSLKVKTSWNSYLIQYSSVILKIFIEPTVLSSAFF